MESWAALKAWYDLAWNSQNGYLHYKADMIGTIIVNQHDKKGLVLRRVTFQNCQLKAVGGPSLTYEGQGILQNITANFVCDYLMNTLIRTLRYRLHLLQVINKFFICINI